MRTLSPTAKLLSSIWSYPRKWFPQGILVKLKARICANWKQQECGRDFWDTYAPVASWSTIHFLLILSSILNLKSCQVDNQQAFPQGALSDPVFIQIPQGWYVTSSGELSQCHDPKYNNKTHYLHLKCNLFGIKQATHNWLKHLSNCLQRLGFPQSNVDCCLFLRHGCVTDSIKDWFHH